MLYDPKLIVIKTCCRINCNKKLSSGVSLRALSYDRLPKND